MSQVSALQSLDLILEDVSAEINLSINGLEQYSKNLKQTSALKKSLEHLNKLKGVFTLLEMRGAQRLVTDATVLVRSLPKKKVPKRRQLLEILTTALARLMRYTEHVNQKPNDLPQLLIPAINSMRKSINAPILGESAFFKANVNKLRANCKMVAITSEASAELSRRFRQMYQIGFIEVLRKRNVNGGLKMMQRAMSNLDNDCPRTTVPNLWWIAETVLEAFCDGSLRMTKSRLKLFSRLDIQVKSIEKKLDTNLKELKSDATALAKEMLYLAMLSGSDSYSVKSLLEHFELEPSDINDAVLIEESRAMRGPSEKDFHSVAETLNEEINGLRQAIENSKENDFEPLDKEQTRTQFNNLASLLKVLQVDDQGIRLSVANDLLTRAIKDDRELVEKDLSTLNIVLESIGNVITESELANYASSTSLKRAVLPQDKLDLCDTTSNHIKQVIRSFSEFTQNNRKQTCLKDVHEALIDVHSGFELFGLQQPLAIVEGCQVFVDYHLMKNPHSTPESSLNLFADIITSLDFYLDTLKFTAEPGTKTLEFAEDCLLQLSRESKHQSN